MAPRRDRPAAKAMLELQRALEKEALRLEEVLQGLERELKGQSQVRQKILEVRTQKSFILTTFSPGGAAASSIPAAQDISALQGMGKQRLPKARS